MSHFSRKQYVEQSSEMEARANALHLQAAALVASLDLPADYRTRCLTLAELRKTVAAAQERYDERQFAHRIGTYGKKVTDAEGDALAAYFCDGGKK